MDARASDVYASKTVNRFEGLSTLRAKEREVQPKGDQAKALEKYLLKYGDATASGKEGKVKGKKRKRPPATSQSLRIVDMDASGFVDKPKELAKKKAEMAKFLQDGSEGDEENEEDAPVVANAGEAELLARLVAKEKSGAALQNWETIDAEADTPSRAGNQARSRGRRHDSPDHSPPRRQRHDSPDASPPRRKGHDITNASPPRRQRHDSPDASPPRRQRHDSPDASPPRRQRHGSPDASPPRRPQKTSSAISPGKEARAPHESLTRKRARGQDDASPPRRKRMTPDASPPRRRSDNDADLGPSSPRHLGSGRDSYTAGRNGGQGAGKQKDGHKGMTDGSRAGMVSGKELVEELAKKRDEERKRFARLEAASGSRDANTVYRNAETGARMSKEEFEAAAKKAAEKKKDIYEAPEWGGGMRQIREREQRAQDMIAERSKPFARTADDVDKELNLRDRQRFGDPMAHLVRQREAAPPPAVIPERMAKQLRKSGFLVPQEVPTHSWLKRNLGPPPNRYGIRPGRHWDGVDRSTGFERDYFKMKATRTAEEREARAWAQADM